MSITAEGTFGWVRVGASTLPTFGLVAIGVATFSSFFLGPRMRDLVGELTKQNHDGDPIELYTGLVTLILVGVPMLFLVNFPAKIDLRRRLIRVGWRTLSFDELHHAYRMLAGRTSESFLIRLEVPWGPDARLPIVSDMLPPLTPAELDTLLAMLELAPIETKPGTPVCAPLGDELGPRNAGARVDDRVSRAIQPYRAVSYSKPTVLLELRSAIERARAVSETDATGLNDESDLKRAFAALGSTLGTAKMSSRRSLGRMWTFFPAKFPVINSKHGRGFWGTLLGTFLRQQRHVEEWLTSAGVSRPDRHRRVAATGWAVILFGIVMPWMFPALENFSDARGIVVDRYSEWFMWGSGLSAVLWPLVIWSGSILTHRARVARFVSDRAATFAAKVDGATVPARVSQFFGAPYPERSYRVGVFAYKIALIVALSILGIFLVIEGFALKNASDPVGGWLIVGAVIVLIVIVGTFVRMRIWPARVHGPIARADAEWRVISDRLE